MIPLTRWVAPFGDPRITGRSPLPSAFRSVPRPSSPLGAKASTRCPSRAAPAPSPKHAATPRAKIRGQRPEVRWLSVRPRRRRLAFLTSDLRSLTSGTGAQAPPRRCSRIGSHACVDARASAQRIPMPRPDLAPKDDRRTCFTVTTRFTMSREQRTEIRGQTRRSAALLLRHNFCGPDAKRQLRRLPSSVPCLLPSELTTPGGGPGPI
jgi:hypothetical protein